MSWQLALSGLLIGALVGTTGMGGGSLMTPLLVIVFGFNPAVAVGTDLVHGALFKTVGAIRHRALGTVQARLSGWMLLGSAPMSLVGVWVSGWMRHHYGDGAQTAQARVLAVALLIGAAGILAKNLVHFREAPDVPFILARRDRIAAVLIGLGGGFMVGLTSVGSGVFFGLSLLILFPLRSAKVVGTDIFHAAALLWVAGTGHLIAGQCRSRFGRMAARRLAPGCADRLPSERAAARPGAATRARDHACGERVEAARPALCERDRDRALVVGILALAALAWSRRIPEPVPRPT